MGRYSDALDDLNAALQLDPSAYTCLYQRANVLYELGRYADARADYQRLQRQFPHSQEAVFGLARCAAREQNFGMANDLADRAVDYAPDKAESYILESNVLVYQGQDVLLEKMVEYPVYLERGDRLYYEITLQSAIPVKIYNMDAGSTVKTYNKSSIKDSLIVAYPGIYLLEIKPSTSQYASIDISYHTDNMDRIYNPKSVRTETVSCSKGDFRAYGIKGIKMQNLFEEPRKFTLRSQLKSAFSGSSIALVPVQVPTGATDILYSMRIATSEQDRSSDGDFHRNLSVKYNQIKFMGLPLYERNQGSHHA